jgi:hypothetical protein
MLTGNGELVAFHPSHSLFLFILLVSEIACLQSDMRETAFNESQLLSESIIWRKLDRGDELATKWI